MLLQDVDTALPERLRPTAKLTLFGVDIRFPGDVSEDDARQFVALSELSAIGNSKNIGL